MGENLTRGPGKLVSPPVIAKRFAHCYACIIYIFFIIRIIHSVKIVVCDFAHDAKTFGFQISCINILAVKKTNNSTNAVFITYFHIFVCRMWEVDNSTIFNGSNMDKIFHKLFLTF